MQGEIRRMFICCCCARYSYFLFVSRSLTQQTIQTMSKLQNAGLQSSCKIVLSAKVARFLEFQVLDDECNA